MVVTLMFKGRNVSYSIFDDGRNFCKMIVTREFRRTSIKVFEKYCAHNHLNKLRCYLLHIELFVTLIMIYRN